MEWTHRYYPFQYGLSSGVLGENHLLLDGFVLDLGGPEHPVPTRYRNRLVKSSLYHCNTDTGMMNKMHDTHADIHSTRPRKLWPSTLIHEIPY